MYEHLTQNLLHSHTHRKNKQKNKQMGWLLMLSNLKKQYEDLHSLKLLQLWYCCISFSLLCKSQWEQINRNKSTAQRCSHLEKNISTLMHRHQPKMLCLDRITWYQTEKQWKDRQKIATAGNHIKIPTEKILSIRLTTILRLLRVWLSTVPQCGFRGFIYTVCMRLQIIQRNYECG